MLAAFLALSLALNVGLTTQVRRLAALSEKPLSPTVEIGKRIASISVKDSRGQIESIPLASGLPPVIVYAVSPFCVWCERNLENIRALAAKRSTAFRFIGVSASPISREQIASMRLGFDVFEEDPAHRVLAQLGITGTPTTVVVSSDGVIMDVWRGAFFGDTAISIQKFFALSIPNTR